MDSVETKPNRGRKQFFHVIKIIEYMLLKLHLVVLSVFILIHLFLLTKLFWGMVATYNFFERDYWFFSNNMTEETGVYGPLLTVLQEDFLWILQSYIPILLPFVLLVHYLDESEGAKSIWNTIWWFCARTLMTLMITIVFG